MRMRRHWATRFGLWVRGYGASRLAADPGRAVYGQPITRQAIYGWVAGRSTPRPALALRIVGLAHGRLTLADLYRQRFGAAEAQAHGCPHAGSVTPAGVQTPPPDR